MRLERAHSAECLSPLQCGLVIARTHIHTLTQVHTYTFPFLDGNIPTKPAYGVYISQLVRIGRICDDFRERHRILTTRLLKQGFKYDQLCSYFKRFSGKYKDIFAKFKTALKQHIKDSILLPLNTVNRLVAVRYM